MKYTISVIAIFLFSFTASMAQNKFKASDIVGEWHTKDNRSIVKIIEKDGKFYGKIIWVNEDEAGKKDTKNPNEKLRDRPILGIVFMKGFVFNEEDQVWEKGKVYDPESGNIYSGTLRLKDKNTMDLRGYVGISLLGRTETWTRKK